MSMSIILLGREKDFYPGHERAHVGNPSVCRSRQKRYTFFYMADLQIKGLIRAFESLKPELYVTGYTGE